MIYPEIFYGLSSILYIVLFWVAFSIISTHTNIYFFDGRFLRSFNLYRLVFDLKFEEKNSIDLSALKKVKNLNHVNMKQSIYKQTGLYKFQIKLSQLVFGF